MKDDTGEIFTLDEVAAYLKVGKRTVYRLAAGKKIPAFKVGGTWRFRRQEIDLWIKKQTAEAQGDDGPGGAHGGNGVVYHPFCKFRLAPLAGSARRSV